VDASGSSLASYAYDAFGNEQTPDAGDTNPFRYCGEYWDVHTNALYLRARDYKPGIGRFLSQDTVRQLMREMPNGQQLIDPLSLNLYTYCHNNPIMYVDEDGHWIHIAAGALIGGTNCRNC
jgi:RHS repeat-associated protein